MRPRPSARSPGFLPGLEAFETRWVLIAAATGIGIAGLVRVVVAGEGTSVGAQVVDFARRNLGRQVGDGECAALAAEAVQAAGGRPFSQLGPTGDGADYVWGRRVATWRAGEGGNRTRNIQPGDIIQFRNVSFETFTRVTEKDSSYATNSQTFSYPHHTAIVSKVTEEAVEVFQQNVGPDGKSADSKRIVQVGVIRPYSHTVSTEDRESGSRTEETYTFQNGTMWVYRPYAW